MVHKAWATNDILLASEVNAYLMNQTVVVCTSSTRPTAVEGMMLYETDTDRLMVSTNGSTWTQVMDIASWQTYTPTLTATTSNPTLGSGSAQTGRYTRLGDTIIGQARVAFGTSGVAAGSGEYRVSLPVTSAAYVNYQPIGNCVLFDSSSGNMGQPTACFATAGNLAEFEYPAAAPVGALVRVSNSAPWTWAASDAIWFNFCYEV